MEIWISGAREVCFGSGDVEVVEVWRSGYLELGRYAAGLGTWRL